MFPPPLAILAKTCTHLEFLEDWHDNEVTWSADWICFQRENGQVVHSRGNL